MAVHLENKTNGKKRMRKIKANKRENKNKQENLRADQRWTRHRRLLWNTTLPSCLCDGKKNAGYPMVQGSLSPCAEKTDQKSMTGGGGEGNPSPSSAEAFNLCQPGFWHTPQPCWELRYQQYHPKTGEDQPHFI